ncbi:Predicted thiol-disulfide oxidoreductase YuxK, DCC family [Halopseudomonas sabulinigri]|uniref:Predicted thiol-disulfide oxidoreductase YuxK, DCC family n=1 Tax=Halopseudomonas sabulinigri TaxID=472181 RepID=A0A1H1UAF6_9GAMM|nr:thiol-disulfide oxidoreductase DCC family protein [Halopseudomonas sabulinigri]SDS69417.1 Predicted thiol-disulfide oxidoreductase YuxK, DCC family [Halopseudomonas sabulinigri]
MNNRVSSIRPVPPERIILFDAVCKLCNGWANFLITHDHGRVYRLCSVQSTAGEQLLQQFGYPTDQVTTMLVIEQGRCCEKSEAFFRVMRGLGWPWRVLVILRLVPRPVRDWLYDRIALNRYRLFGRYDYCRLPSADHAERFLDND